MTTADLRERFPCWMLEERSPVLLCAVSGGLDSMCLLDLLLDWAAPRGRTIVAAHFNHRLRGAAEQDAAFVRAYCRERGVPAVFGEEDVRALAERERLSLEEAARTARYAFLRREAEGLGASIYTAHHAGDNAETVLLNLIRGTGLPGLTGMERRREGLCRPLLGVARRELEAYAAAYGLPHVEDETNRDPDAAARNRVRLELIPLLERLNPRAVEHINQTAAILARENEALEVLAEMEGSHAMKDSAGRRRMFTAVLESWPRAASERTVLRLMAGTAGHQRDFTAKHVQAVLALKAGGCLSLPHGLSVRREGDCLYFERTAPRSPAVYTGMGETVEFGDWRVTLGPEPAEGESCLLSLPPELPLTVTHWRPADRMRLCRPGQRGSRSLKRLCAERGIPPWQRDRLPVLRAGEQAAAVPGVGVDCAFAPRKGASCYVSFCRVSSEEEREGGTR